MSTINNADFVTVAEEGFACRRKTNNKKKKKDEQYWELLKSYSILVEESDIYVDGMAHFLQDDLLRNLRSNFTLLEKSFKVSLLKEKYSKDINTVISMITKGDVVAHCPVEEFDSRNALFNKLQTRCVSKKRQLIKSSTKTQIPVVSPCPIPSKIVDSRSLLVSSSQRKPDSSSWMVVDWFLKCRVMDVE